jgi:thioester reductase-like protein
MICPKVNYLQNLMTLDQFFTAIQDPGKYVEENKEELLPGAEKIYEIAKDPKKLEEIGLQAIKDWAKSQKFSGDFDAFLDATAQEIRNLDEYK